MVGFFGRGTKEPEVELVGRELLTKLKTGAPKVAAPFVDEARRSLESLYTIETIDVKSIRPIKEVKEEKKEERLERPQAELALPLGGKFRTYRGSFILTESIHVLSFSSHLEKLLVDSGRKRIGDLYLMQKEDFLKVKGLGGGHIDEVLSKLKKYMEDKRVQEVLTVDFGALLRSLIVFVKPQHLAVALLPFEAAHLIPLTHEERAEMKRQEGVREGLLEPCRPFLQFALKEIGEVYLLPWMERRGGVCSKKELLERIERVASDSKEAKAALDFFEEEFSLTLFDEFVSLGNDLFASDTFTAQRFGRVIERADSYLKSSPVPFNFEELAKWLLRDLSLEWEWEELSYIKHALRLFPLYRVWMGESGLELGLNLQASHLSHGFSPTGS